MEAILVDRPGNLAISENDRTRLNVVESLDAVNLAEEIADGGSTSPSPEVEAGGASGSSAEDDNYR
jgi:hypothetical protein